MKIACLFVCCLLLSCSAKQFPTLPQLQLVSVAEHQKQICEDAFIKGDWQFVHSINFATSSGTGVTLVGVTVVEGKSLKTVLMGVEGFVLFEAEQDATGQLVVRKAIPPFDRPGFAEGLMHDVQSLFIEPVNGTRVLGKNTQGELLCRYTAADKQISDVVTAVSGWDRITLYDNKGMLHQAISSFGYKKVADQYIPERIELTRLGAQGYTLELQLLGADKL